MAFRVIFQIEERTNSTMNQLFQDILDQGSEYYEQIVIWLPKFIIGMLVLILSWLIARAAKRGFQKRLANRLDDPLLTQFLAQITKIFIIVIGFLLTFSIIGMGRAASGLLAGAGVGAFIIGFAFKDIGENFLAGIIMAFDRPFRIGDIVLIGGHEGVIRSLTLRDTHMKTFDGKDVYIPNGMIIKNPIVNYTIDGFLRHSFSIRLEYKADIDKARQIILDTLHEVNNILTEDRGPNVFVQELNPSAVVLGVQYWLNTADPNVSGLAVKTEATHKVIQALRVAGYHLPKEVLEIRDYAGIQSGGEE